MLTTFRRHLILLSLVTAAFVLGAFPTAHARGTLILSPDGLTVYDTVHDVTWLADFNLPASNHFGVPLCDGSHATPCVNASGSMNWASAEAWIAGMQASHYLGREDWRIPTTPPTDLGCGKKGPHGNSFGFGCSASALGSLYYTALGLQAPDTAVPIPPNSVGPFINFQPYLYWSQSSRGGGGFATFSFNTGFHGANTAPNFLYVLPMFEGQIPTLTWPPPDGKHLVLDTSGRAVYDPETDRTFPADANLPATRAFGMPPCTDPTTPAKCINPQDGSMTADSAAEYIIKMNNQTYLNQSTWELPTIEIGCGMYECSGSDNPMGNLYYSQFHLMRGTPIVNAPNIPVGPFHNIQPYLYWACSGEAFEAQCHPRGPANNFEWSFSYGNGFEGTDLVGNTLYVTVYFNGQRKDLRAAR